MIMPLCNRMFCCIFGWYFYNKIRLEYEKNILLSSSRAFSLSTTVENSEATWKKATKCNKVSLFSYNQLTCLLLYKFWDERLRLTKLNSELLLMFTTFGTSFVFTLKIMKLGLQSQLSMSKKIRIFLISLSLKNFSQFTYDHKMMSNFWRHCFLTQISKTAFCKDWFFEIWTLCQMWYR